jgi:hypothetical protein
MKDFNSYSQQNYNRGTNNTGGNVAGGNTAGGNVAGGAPNQNRTDGRQTNSNPNNVNNAEQVINMAAMIAKAFSGKSEGQIWQTILSQAEQGKKEGTLTNADLDNFFAAVAPMMDGFKRKKLYQIIERLKAI